MKYINLLLLVTVFLIASCKGNDPTPPYVYEANPHYSFGYIEFFGSYYSDYSNSNNVISLSLFSDSLRITSEGSLEGFGQYLHLEDVFIAPTDTLLQSGTYTIDASGLPFTVAPGKNDTIDTIVYPIGATISYYEKNAAKSTLKIITSGSFTLSKIGTFYNISCNFKTSDDKELSGTFISYLPFIDESILPVCSSVRKRIHYFVR